MNAFCYTDDMQEQVNRLRERRRNAIANNETGLYHSLTDAEAEIHGGAYLLWLDLHSSDPLLRAHARGWLPPYPPIKMDEPFAQPADLSKPSPFSPELPIAGPKTMAPWAAGIPPAPAEPRDVPWTPEAKPQPVAPPPTAWEPKAAPAPTAKIVARRKPKAG